MTKRQPKGTPVGGQFAEGRKPEGDVVLREPTAALLRALDAEIATMGLLASREDAPRGSFSIDFNNSIIGSPYIGETGWYPDLQSAKVAANSMFAKINNLAVRYLAENPSDGDSWTDPLKEASSSWANISSAEDADGQREGDPAFEEQYFGEKVEVAAAPKSKYKSQAARDAERTGYGDQRYWDYLEESAIDYDERGVIPDAMTRSLSDSLRGNEGI